MLLHLLLSLDGLLGPAQQHRPGTGLERRGGRFACSAMISHRRCVTLGNIGALSSRVHLLHGAAAGEPFGLDRVDRAAVRVHAVCVFVVGLVLGHHRHGRVGPAARFVRG